MKRAAVRYFFCVCAMFSMLAAQNTSYAQSETDVIGTVTQIQKAAVALQDALPRVLSVGSDIQLGDIISTGKGARLKFELNDGTEVTLGERAQFVVLEFVMGENNGNAVMRMIEGAFAVTSGKMMELVDASMEVQTETATIGIRGTTFWGGILNGEDLEIALLAGKGVYVETKAGIVELSTIGDGTTVTAGNEPPSDASAWPTTKIDKAKATVTFAQ